MAYAGSNNVALHGARDAAGAGRERHPSHFGKYQLLERIAVGDIAEIFKAKVAGIEGFERVVALKRILPGVAEDATFLSMLIEEAKHLAQLQHENLVQLLDLGRVEDSYYVALEFVEGRDLRDILTALGERGQVMPTPQSCYLVMQLCEGLDYAHQQRDVRGRALNLVHGGISPENVLVGYEGEVKLTDFGIAEAASRASKTHPGILKGKFGYMSPEQVRDLPVDRRSDIFALGILLHEMLTGRRLFESDSELATLTKLRDLDIPALSASNPAIPAALERIVQKALAKNAAERYQRASELRHDLDRFLDSIGELPSRNGLAAWMKRTFGGGIQPERPYPRAADATPTPAVPPPAQSRVVDEEGLDWDEEEKATEIFARAHGMPSRPMGNDNFAGEPEGKTLAAETTPVLAAATDASFPATEPGRPRPVVSPFTQPTVSPPPTPRRLFVPELPARAACLTPFPGTPLLPEPPPAFPATGQVGLAPMPVRKSLHRRYYLLVLPMALLGGVLGYFLVHRSGRLQVSVQPPDARLMMDGRAVAGEPPFRLDERAGVHRLTVSRPGYVAFEREVMISARQKGQLDIALKPSPDTGFTLSSTPPGGLVWLDGRPLVLDRRGKQATTDLVATRIAPGPHVLVIKGPPQFRPWELNFLQEPGRTVSLHADLVPRPAGDAPAARAAVAGTAGTAVGTPEPGHAARAGKLPAANRRRRSARSPVPRADRGDPFENNSRGSRTNSAKSQQLPTEDIFESYGKPAAGAAGDCVATIGSKPWAELFIDGKPTGKLTPLVSYALPCGKHRLTFRNEDLMIERNESVTLVPGRPFRKIFPLVADAL
jgi:serine/threonine protein kinase